MKTIDFKTWTPRDFAANAEFKLENGKMTFNLTSGEYVIK